MPPTSARRLSLGRPLPTTFFDRDTEIVARELLGAVLDHRSPDGRTAGRIVEVEAYPGPHDPACHSAVGLTKRNASLHGPPGSAYVYFIYGVHWCVNAVTRERGYGSAVLIRGVAPLIGLDLIRRRRGAVPDRSLADGPGKLCKAFGIDGSLDGASLQSGALRILSGEPVDPSLVEVGPRIGISKAKDWPLRFIVRDR